MKKVLHLILCAFIGTHSYQQTNTIKKTDIPLTSGFQNLVTTNSINSGVTYKGKRIYPQKAADNTLGFDGAQGFKYNPGDTIVLTAAQSPYSWVQLANIDSVTIINEGGQVILNWFNNGAIPGGFIFNNCKHIHLTGTGAPGIKYGFLVTTPANRGVGADIHGRSAWFEIDHCEMYNKNAGLWVKEEQADAACIDSLSFPNWVLHDFKLHDLYIHNTSAEGMYLGSTAPNGFEGSQHPSVYCSNGRGDSLLPMRLGNFHIYNNFIDSTSRGAIQISDADSGESEINNNQICNIGYEYNNQQGNGIVLGGYTQAYVHDNVIWNTYASGIFSLGAGLVKIKNNKVNYTGFLNGRTSSGFANIEVDTRNTTNPSPGKSNPEFLTFVVKNNQLGSNTDCSIRVYNTYLTYNKDNQICSNVIIHTTNAATYAVPSGIAYTTCSSQVNSLIASANDAKVSGINSSYLFPNPARDVLNLKLNNKLTGNIILSIYNAGGSLLQTKNITKGSGELSQTLNVKSLSAGLYTLQILSGETKTYLKFIKQ